MSAATRQREYPPAPFAGSARQVAEKGGTFSETDPPALSFDLCMPPSIYQTQDGPDIHPLGKVSDAAGRFGVRRSVLISNFRGAAGPKASPGSFDTLRLKLRAQPRSAKPGPHRVSSAFDKSGPFL